MKSIKNKALLDPLWMARSRNIDLEYYEFILMAAKQSFDKAMIKGYSNLQEIIFHYLNINHIISEGRIFDSSLAQVKDGNIPSFFEGFKKKDAGIIEILRMSEVNLADILIDYLNKALIDLASLQFYFNSTRVHTRDKVYIVFKYVDIDEYEIWKLDYNPKMTFGFEFKQEVISKFYETAPNAFKQKVIGIKPELSDFEPNQNVLVVICNSHEMPKLNALTLAKDMIIANKSINHEASFDSNAMLDLLSVVEKRKGPALTTQPRI